MKFTTTIFEPFSVCFFFTGKKGKKITFRVKKCVTLTVTLTVTLSVTLCVTLSVTLCVTLTVSKSHYFDDMF